MAQRSALDDVGDGLGLAAVGFQELEPGGRGGEEIARLDPRAERLAAGLDRAFRPVLDDEPEARRRARGPRADFEPRHRGDRRQRLAAEAEGHDRGQVAVGDFRGRMALDGKLEIRFVHAAPVVGNADEPPPARLDRDLDMARAGVERVLDELLDRRGRPLDHFARGDAVNKQRIETANRHGERTSAKVIALDGCRGEGGRAVAEGLEATHQPPPREILAKIGFYGLRELRSTIALPISEDDGQCPRRLPPKAS